jgi:hypothetical protein
MRLLSINVINLSIRRTYNRFFLCVHTDLKKLSKKPYISTLFQSNCLSVPVGTVRLCSYSYYTNLYLYSFLLNNYVSDTYGGKFNLVLINASASLRYYHRWYMRQLNPNHVLKSSINKLYSIGLFTSRLKGHMATKPNYRRTCSFISRSLKRHCTITNNFKVSFKGKLRKLRSNFFTYGFGSISKNSRTSIYNDSSFYIINKIGVSKVTCSTNVSSDESRFYIDSHDYTCW